MNPYSAKSIAMIALAAIVSLAAAPPASAQPKDSVIAVPNGDTDMEAAIAKARAALPEFWKTFAAPKPGEESFALKVRFATGGQNGEHIWVNGLKKQPDGSYTGTLDDEPQEIAGKKAGDAVTFKDADISDWMFLRRGKIVGNETMRPLLKQMPKAEADAFRAMLETP